VEVGTLRKPHLFGVTEMCCAISVLYFKVKLEAIVAGTGG